MTEKSQNVLEEALKLTAHERAELAEQLIASLDEAPDTDVEQAWQEKIRRRCEEIDSGKVTLVDSETVFAELRKKYSE